MRTFEEFHKCKGGKIVFNEDQAKCYGNSSLIYLECTKCKKHASLQTVGTSNKQWQVSNAMDVNRRIVYSACEMGVGREAIAVMCEIFNMPTPCSTPSWDKHQEALYAAHLKAVATRLEAARQEVHDLHCQRNPDTTEDIIDVTVSFDGTWSKRGFTAPFGIGFAISAETGQVLDYDFASKLCLPCSRNKKNLSEEVFKTWYATHKPYCTENHTGSSGSIEREIAKIWVRTESYHMRFKYRSVMVTARPTNLYGTYMDVMMFVRNMKTWTGKIPSTKSGSVQKTTRNGRINMTLDRQIAIVL